MAAVSVPHVSVPSSTITVISTEKAADSATTSTSESIGSAVTVNESLAPDTGVGHAVASADTDAHARTSRARFLCFALTSDARER